MTQPVRPYRLGGISIAADTPTEDLIEEIIQESNAARMQNQILPQLVRHWVLDEVARVRGEDMVTEKYFGHDDPNRNPGKYHDIMKSMGVETWNLAGENLWTGESGFSVGEIPFAVVRGFMNSAGHRQNLLDPIYDSIGVSVLFRPDIGWNVVTCIYAGGMQMRP
jgi:uncharacterized protein YkwD